ncbi:hypothetical protein TIFTF001_041796, partial [Ficus carica]
MESGRSILSGRFMAFLVVLIVLFLGTSNAKIDGIICSPSSCGDILNISSPFRLKSDPENCGNSRYELSCENNLTVLYLYSVKYLVKAINYSNYTIRIVNANVQKDNCSSIPNHSLNKYDFRYDEAYDTYQWTRPKKHPSSDRKLTKAIIFLKCENRMNSSLYIDTAPCNIAGMFPDQDTGANSSLSKRQSYYYVVDGSLLNVSDLNNHCRIELTTLMSRNRMNGETNTSYVDIHNELTYGFELSWLPSFLQQLCIGGGSCYIGDSNKVHCSCYRPWDIIELCLAYFVMLLTCFGMYACAKFVFGAPVVVAFLIYKWRRRHLSMFNSIEEFLHSHNNLTPIRYSYSDIKKMTKNFKNKLGEGGFGSVFKGKLRSGRLVAIKILSKSKGKGQDFINEI